MAPDNGQTGARRVRTWLGIVLIVAGLCGHLLAARAIGGYYIAYRDHIAGFTLLTVVTWLILAAVGRRFWPGRRDVTILVLGVIQTLVGVYIYINRFHLM